MARNLIQKTHPQSRRPSVIVVTSCDVTFYTWSFLKIRFTKKSIFSKILTKYPSVALKIESVIRRTIVEPPPSFRVSHTLSSIQYLFSHSNIDSFCKTDAEYV